MRPRTALQAVLLALCTIAFVAMLAIPGQPYGWMREPGYNGSLPDDPLRDVRLIGTGLPVIMLAAGQWFARRRALTPRWLWIGPAALLAQWLIRFVANT